MTWFYAKDGAQLGPVEAFTVLELAASGDLSSESLVWTESFADWQPLATARPTILEAARIEKPDHAICSVSGQWCPKRDLLQFGESWVHPDHKAEFVQSLSEDVPLPNAIGQTDVVQYGELNLGNVFGGAWKFFFRHLSLIATMTLIVLLVPNLLVAFLQSLMNLDETWQGTRQELKLDQLVEGFITIIVYGGILFLCYQREIGITPSLGDCLRAGLRNWGRLWLANFILGAVVFGIALITALPIIFGIAKSAEGPSAPVIAGSVIWGLIGLGFIIFFVIRFSLSHTIVMEENSTTKDAVMQSFQMTKGHFFRILGYMIVATFVFMIPAIFLFALTALPGLDNWIAVGIVGTLVTVFQMFFVVITFFIYRHLPRATS